MLLAPLLHHSESDSGFTLLEILLVIVIMSVTAMMLAPSFFSATTASLDGEGRRLVQVLRLAQDEATLGGQPFRMRIRPHSYEFQTVSGNGEWHAMQSSPFLEYHLPEGFQLLEVRPQPPLSEQSAQPAGSAAQKREAVLADVLIPAAGGWRPSDIVLAAEPDSAQQVVIEFRPGPGGIRMRKEAQ